jgi:hypothetical protein
VSATAAIQLSGDVLVGDYALSFEGRTFRVERREGITYVLDEQGRNALGTVRPATPASGSVWNNGDCIGEYYLEHGEYVVTPMRDGFRQPDEKVKSHPILFLLRALKH